MTDPKALADALVEAGIVEKFPDEKEWWLYGIRAEFPATTVKRLITDWRVAGKVLESMEPHKIGLLVLNHGSNNDCPGYSMFNDPRAIIEAWYEAR